MNYSAAVFLVNDNCRAIEAIYEADTDNKKAPRSVFKTFDEAIEIDDIIVVPSSTRHNFTTCRVTAVDVEIDPESSAQIEWIVGIVDTSEYEEMRAIEEKAITQIKAAEKTHAREELRKKMFAHMDETSVKALQIANIASLPATAQK